jgi:hypothetical protein
MFFVERQRCRFDVAAGDASNPECFRGNPFRLGATRETRTRGRAIATTQCREQEVKSLRKQTASVPEGKMKTKVTYDGKEYVEKAVAEEEKPPVFVIPRASALKLVLNYIHTWSDFRDANPEFGQGQFDEVIARVQLMF